MMKSFFAGIALSSFPITCLYSSPAAAEKSTDLSVVYGVCAAVSFLLLVSCLLLIREKKGWFVLLFSSVLIVNVGYTYLALARCLEAALMANRLAYLGSVFLPVSMLMILLNATNTPYKKWHLCALISLAVVIFLITASPGILPIYYREVSFAQVNGTFMLIKTYGPLHPLYLVYLVGYFAAMVTVIVRASLKKAIQSTAHAVILAGAVFVNIGVWFIEQFVSVGFEILAVSYIISELFLLGVYLMMKENQRLRVLAKQAQTIQNRTEKPEEISAPIQAADPAKIEIFVAGITALTPTERIIFDAYVARMTTKEILAKLNIKENTLKYHNRNIFGKLGISSRNELLELHKQQLYTKTSVSTTP